MSELRPIKVKHFRNIHDATNNNEPISEFKGFFHRWAEQHQRVGEVENGGAGAIIEKKDGQVVLVMLGETVSMRFTDVGPQEKLEDVACDCARLHGGSFDGCKDCGGTGLVKRMVTT